MIYKNEIFPIGKVTKPHGINGEMSFTFTTNVFDTEDAPYFIFEMDGIFVPFFIESYRFKTDSTALLKLDGINSEEDARQFNGLTIYLPIALQEKMSEEDITMEYFVGFTIEDKNAGVLGEISAIDETTENVLFIIEQESDELLIPANDDFILEINHEKRVITTEIPEGLLDL